MKDPISIKRSMWNSTVKGVRVDRLRQLLRMIQRLWAPPLATPSIAPGGRQVVFAHAHSALDAFEGLFVASVFSALFWSALTLTLIHLL